MHVFLQGALAFFVCLLVFVLGVDVGFCWGASDMKCKIITRIPLEVMSELPFFNSGGCFSGDGLELRDSEQD